MSGNDDGARNGSPSSASVSPSVVVPRSYASVFDIGAIAGRGRAHTHARRNILNDLPKCTLFSHQGEVPTASSTPHCTLSTARKRGGVKREEEKHYTLRDTCKTAPPRRNADESASFPLPLGQFRSLPTMRGAACVALASTSPAQVAPRALPAAARSRRMRAQPHRPMAERTNARCARFSV